MNATKTQHTPGPWEVVRRTGSIARGENYPEVVGFRVSASLYGMERETVEANARLIAAAPKLKTWILNVATDAQLDAPVPALGGQTGRQLLTEIKG